MCEMTHARHRNANVTSTDDPTDEVPSGVLEGRLWCLVPDWRVGVLASFVVGVLLYTTLLSLRSVCGVRFLLCLMCLLSLAIYHDTCTSYCTAVQRRHRGAVQQKCFEVWDYCCCTAAVKMWSGGLEKETPYCTAVLLLLLTLRPAGRSRSGKVIVKFWFVVAA